MSPRLPVFSFVLILSSVATSHAEEKSGRGDTGESWFAAPASADAVVQDTPTREREPASNSLRPSRAPSSEVSQPAVKSSVRIPPVPTVPVQFEPDDASVRLLDQNGVVPYETLVPSEWPGWWGWPYPYGYYHAAGVAPVYSPVCEGPCLVGIRRGAHQFAVAKQGGPIVPITGEANISEPSILRARYVDRGGQRTAGVVIGVVGALGGLVMMVASVHEEQQCDERTCTTRQTVDDAWAASGVVVFVGSIITSAVLLNQRDSAQLSVTPLRLVPPDSQLGRSQLWNRGTSIQGAALTLSF